MCDCLHIFLPWTQRGASAGSSPKASHRRSPKLWFDACHPKVFFLNMFENGFHMWSANFRVPGSRKIHQFHSELTLPEQSWKETQYFRCYVSFRGGKDFHGISCEFERDIAMQHTKLLAEILPYHTIAINSIHLIPNFGSESFLFWLFPGIDSSQPQPSGCHLATSDANTTPSCSSLSVGFRQPDCYFLKVSRYPPLPETNILLMEEIG